MGKYYKYKNLEENRFQEFDKSDILSGPLHIAIDITNKCNAKCLHCFNRSGNGLLRNEISDREMLEIFKEIAVIKPFSTCFCGGEPMMKYDLVLRATEVLKNGGVPNIAMVTNGWFLTKDRVISLRNAGLTHIQLSLDGKDAKTHERMRGINGIYEKVLDALNFIDDAGISSAVAFSPTQFNIKQFPEVVELLQKFENLREIKVQPLMPLGKAVEGKSELFASEEEYRELVAYIERFNAKRDYNNKFRICNLGSYEYSILDKEMYGWCEIVIQRDCKSIEELSRYYQRIGIILFINYLLEGGDIHFENLIACNEYPVIIDAETFIGNIEENNGKSAAEKVASLLRKSVLYSGILPFYSWNNAGDTGINMSAISGEEGQKFPIKIPFIINPKSVNMRVVYDYPVSKGNHNLAMLKGRFIQPSEFADKIIQGFESAYLGAMENTETLLRIIQQYGELEVRYLIRNTQQYAIVLSSSYHPELLVDGGARNLFFYSLANGNLQNQRSRSLIEYEIEDLLSGDIPYFYFRGSKKNIYTWDGREVKDFFSKPALQQIEENIQNLSYKNLEQQTQYIKITFNMENAGTRKIKNKRLKLDLYSNMAKTAEELAKELLDKIGTNAIYSEDGADVNWIGVKLFGIKENQWMIQALPNTLYDGTVGINLVFHLYEWIYHDRKYHKICEVLDNRLLRYIDTISEGEQNIEDFNTGIFSGEGSILYTLGILYEIYDDIKYKEYFDKWLNCMETLILEDRLFDMISGNSGIVLVLINMYRKTKKPIYLQKAIQIAEQLIENMITENGKVGWKSEVVPEVLAGFAHGNSGFIELFSRLYEVYPQTKYLDILSSLVEYENSLYSEKDNNWIDLRKFSEVDQHKSQPIAWCHGAAGILLSRLTLYNAIKNLGETALLQQAIKDISLAKNKLIEDGLHAGFCLCHGNMGNLLILKRYAEIFDDKQVRSICDSRFEQILEFLNEENILPTELYNPGFMTGLSGIAYALLKYKMPKLPLLIGVEGIYDRNEV